MKLISVTSNGNRLARVSESEFSENICVEYVKFNPENLLIPWTLAKSETFYDQESALKAAEEWLEGAQV